MMDRKTIKSLAWGKHAFHNVGPRTLPGEPVQVRNLGWLYAHKAWVQRFELLAPAPMKPWRYYKRTPGGGLFNYKSLRGESGFVLVAHLPRDCLYATQYASLDLCLLMLARSQSWRSLPITVEADAAVMIHHRSVPLSLERFTDSARIANGLLARPLNITYEPENT